MDTVRLSSKGQIPEEIAWLESSWRILGGRSQRRDHCFEPSMLDDEATGIMMVASSSGKEMQRLQASHHTAPRLIELTTCIPRRN